MQWREQIFEKKYVDERPEPEKSFTLLSLGGNTSLFRNFISQFLANTLQKPLAHRTMCLTRPISLVVPVPVAVKEEKASHEKKATAQRTVSFYDLTTHDRSLDTDKPSCHVEYVHTPVGVAQYNLALHDDPDDDALDHIAPLLALAAQSQKIVRCFCGEGSTRVRPILEIVLFSLFGVVGGIYGLLFLIAELLLAPPQETCHPSDSLSDWYLEGEDAASKGQQATSPFSGDVGEHQTMTLEDWYLDEEADSKSTVSTDAHEKQTTSATSRTTLTTWRFVRHGVYQKEVTLL